MFHMSADTACRVYGLMVGKNIDTGLWLIFIFIGSFTVRLFALIIQDAVLISTISCVKLL